MKPTAEELLRAHLSKLGKKGGQARAGKYDKATLRKWASMGGRPRKGKSNVKP
jgi:hypothetical protein